MHRIPKDQQSDGLTEQTQTYSPENKGESSESLFGLSDIHRGQSEILVPVRERLLITTTSLKLRSQDSTKDLVTHKQVQRSLDNRTTKLSLSGHAGQQTNIESGQTGLFKCWSKKAS